MSSIIYNRAKLEEYLEHIGYAANRACGRAGKLDQLECDMQENSLTVLSELQRKHLGTIPFGNTALHYSQHRTLSLQPNALFHKLIQRKLDGYCMESTGLFYNVLMSLDFDVYATGARVSHAVSGSGPKDSFAGFGHMVLIVTIRAGHLEQYVVDVAFGTQCMTKPLKLEEGTAVQVIDPAEARLVRMSIRELSDRQKVWVYETRSRPQVDWSPAYCFSEVEFLPQDFEIMSFFTSQHHSSWFTQKLVCVKMLLDDDHQTIVGQYVLSGSEVKKRVHGDVKVVKELRTEADRVEALQEFFGIILTKEEIDGISGTVAQLLVQCS